MPDNLSRERVEVTQLPANWRASGAAPPELARVGDEFVGKGELCVLQVPSVLAPKEYNWLINPAHPEFGRLAIQELEPLAYDSRMFGGRRRR